jgi:hypothetical protein
MVALKVVAANTANLRQLVVVPHAYSGVRGTLAAWWRYTRVDMELKAVIATPAHAHVYRQGVTVSPLQFRLSRSVDIPITVSA